MAIIHQSHPTLEEKIQQELEARYEKRFQEEKNLFYSIQNKEQESYAWRKQEYRKAVPLKILLLLIAVALAVLLVMNLNAIRPAQDAVHALLQGAEDALRDYRVYIFEVRQPLYEVENLLEGIKSGLLWLWEFVIIILPIVLWPLKVSSGVLVVLLCFAVPVGLGIYAVLGLKNVPQRSNWCVQEFHEERVRHQVQSEDVPGEIKILQSGAEGEAKALEEMKTLDNSCHVYTNLRIPDDGKVSETDIIVVAPEAVTIVEVKDYQAYQARLRGDWSDSQLLLEEERSEKVYRRTIYNPVKQVTTHVCRLSHYLCEHGVNAEVNCCVLFTNTLTNKDVKLHAMKDARNALAQCPVFVKGYDDSALHAYLRQPRKGTDGSQVIPLLNKLVQ